MGRKAAALPISPLGALVLVATLTWVMVVLTSPAELSENSTALRGLREAQSKTEEMKRMQEAVAALNIDINSELQKNSAAAAPPQAPSIAAAPPQPHPEAPCVGDWCSFHGEGKRKKLYRRTHVAMRTYRHR